MPMLLKGENGNEFEFALIEDRLPELQDGFGDETMVIISFRVAMEDEEWEETAPCLNLFEVQNLIEWLDGVAGARSDEAEMELNQPELRFAVVKDHGEDDLTLRVGFHLDARPEEFVVDAETTEHTHVDLKLSRRAVRVAVEQLRSDLAGLKTSGKDDITGSEDQGGILQPDEGLNLIDRVDEFPAGAGEGEDNAGNR